MIPVVLQLGPLPINAFGLLLVLAILAAWARLYRDLEWAGEDPELAERIAFWAGLGGVLGARIVFLISFPEGLFNDPLGTIFGGAGFVFYGGLACGTAAVIWVLWRAGRSVAQYADLVTPSLAVGYAVGRLGCQLSGDGDYGIEAMLPWAVSYAYGVFPTEPGVRVHPTPVYEALGALCIAFLLSHLLRGEYFKRAGQLMGVYLLCSSTARFLVEFVRIEPVVGSGLTQAQWWSIVLFIGGLLLLSGKLINREPARAAAAVKTSTKGALASNPA